MATILINDAFTPGVDPEEIESHTMSPIGVAGNWSVSNIGGTGTITAANGLDLDGNDRAYADTGEAGHECQIDMKFNANGLNERPIMFFRASAAGANSEPTECFRVVWLLNFTGGCKIQIERYDAGVKTVMNTAASLPYDHTSGIIELRVTIVGKTITASRKLSTDPSFVDDCIAIDTIDRHLTQSHAGLGTVSSSGVNSVTDFIFTWTNDGGGGGVIAEDIDAGNGNAFPDSSKTAGTVQHDVGTKIITNPNPPAIVVDAAVVSGPITVDWTPPTSGTGVKFTPGHYMVGDEDQVATDLTYVLGKPELVGVTIAYRWNHFETSKGQYDFTRLHDDLAWCQANGKQMKAFVADRDFNSLDPYASLPAYIVDDPIYGAERTNKGWIARVWRQAVMDRIIALLNAMAASGVGVTFGGANAHPNFEGPIFGETALGLLDKTTAVDYTGCDTMIQLNRLGLALTSAFPNCQRFRGANWWNSYGGTCTNNIDMVVDDIYDAGCGMYEPDIILKATSVIRTIAQEYVDNTYEPNGLARHVTVSYQSFNRVPTPTMTEIWNKLDLYEYNYISWIKPALNDPARLGYDNYIKILPDIISYTCPTNNSPCSSGGGEVGSSVVDVTMTGVSPSADGIYDYTVRDALGFESTARVTFGITNIAPVATNQTITVVANDNNLIDPGFNSDGSSWATDADGDPITYTKTADPASGTLSATDDNTPWDYDAPATPGLVTGATFQADDGDSGLHSANITFDVIGIIANDISTNAFSGINIDLYADNYIVDPAGTATITGLGTPDNGGSVSYVGNVITYTPLASFTGIETFTYTIEDPGFTLTDTGTVTATVVEGILAGGASDLHNLRNYNPLAFSSLTDDALIFVAAEDGTPLAITLGELRNFLNGN